MDEDETEDRFTAPRKRVGLWASLRANFLTGLAVVAPVGLTIFIVWEGIGIIDSWVLFWIPDKYEWDWLTHIEIFGVDVRGVGVIIFLIFTVIIGYFAKGLFGRFFLRWGEYIVYRLPIVRTVYNALKQIADTVLNNTETSFDRACLIEYPRKGIWAVAFYSSLAKDEIQEKPPVEGRLISVFLPTTPNPTSGFLLVIPEADVIFLDMSVEDAAKLVISAGLVYPSKDEPEMGRRAITRRRKSKNSGSESE